MKKKTTTAHTNRLFASLVVASSLLIAMAIMVQPNVSFAQWGGGGASVSPTATDFGGGFGGLSIGTNGQLGVSGFGGTTISGGSGYSGGGHGGNGGGGYYGGNYYTPPPVTCGGQTIQDCSVSTNTAGNTSNGSCVNNTVGSCRYSCTSSGSWSKVSNSCTPACAATTINGCNLAATAYGGSAGSCSTGNVGSCNYTCNNGTWTKNTNSCTPGCSATTLTDPTSHQTCSVPTKLAGQSTAGACAATDIGSCSAYCAPTGTIQVIQSCGWGGCTTGANTIPTWQQKTNSCTLKTCSSATLNNCALPAVSSTNQGVAGSCTNGTSGSCNYTCTVQGGAWAYGYVWQKNTNSCAVTTPATCTAQFNPTAVVGGQQSADLSWSSAHATSASYTCTGPSPKSGTLPVSGTATYTYPAVSSMQNEACTITAQGPAGTGSCTASMKVMPSPSCSGSKTGSLSASPNRVATGQSTTLSWQLGGVSKAADVAGCTIKGNDGSTHALQGTPNNACTASGTVSVVVKQQTTYTVYCNGAPVTNAHVTVNVEGSYSNF